MTPVSTRLDRSVRRLLEQGLEGFDGRLVRSEARHAEHLRSCRGRSRRSLSPTMALMPAQQALGACSRESRSREFSLTTRIDAP